ncbi:MAG: hypothetical protein ACXVPD_00430, partial [Bacteroidia bacterium]
MIKRLALLFFVLSTTYTALGQKQKINAAWRALTDYQSTLKEKPDPSYLNKAKDAIDAAAANEESKTNPKMHVYRAQIYYELFKFNLKTMEDALAATVADKNQRRESAYANVSTVELNEAIKSMEFLQKNVKDQNTLQEVNLLGLSMLSDLNNLAVGRYKGKKYDEASGFFESEYSMNAMINGGKKDTATLFNAGLCAQKAKNFEKMARINQMMVNDKLANAGTYQSLYTAKISMQDTAGAIASLQEGRALYPNDMVLLTTETDYFLQTGKQEQSLANLTKTLEKDPNNALLHFITGNIYDGMANPKTPAGKDKDKPANFSELFAKAEEHYKKAIDLKPSNQDYYFNALFNLAALYNNYGVYLYNKAMSDATIAKLVQKQKEITEKSNELYRKAIPYFEQALGVNPDNT